MDLPKIISVDDHVVEPPHVWQTWLPGEAPGARAEGGAQALGQLPAEGRRQVRDARGPRRPLGRRLVYDDELIYVHKRFVAIPESAVGENDEGLDARPLPARDDRAHLRRDARRLLRPRRPDRRHGAQLGRRLAAVPDVPALLRADLPRERGPRARPRLHPCLQRLDGRGVVRAVGRHEHPALPDPAVGRRSSRPRRRRATPSEACARSASASCRLASSCPASTPGYWDPLWQVCNDTGVTVCMHVGSSSSNPAASPDAPQAVGVTLSFNNSFASLTDWLFSGKLVQFPKLKLAYSEGPDRLDPLRARAGRHGVGSTTTAGSTPRSGSPSRRRPTTTAASSGASPLTVTG